MPGYERFLVQIFITLIPVIGLYFSMKDKATKQENRLTILEKDIDEQNKAILVLAEQVKSLGEDVRELKNLIQNKQQ